MENKKVIGVAQVLQHLKDGMTRDDIGEHYGITKAEVKLLFQDERLKGKKTIKKPSFVLVEDAAVAETENVVVDEIEVKAEEVVVENTTETEETKSSFGNTTTDEVETEEVAEVADNAPKATWD